MGGDSSKPNFSEVDSHIKYRNHVNDAYFYEVRLKDPEDREALLRRIKKKEESAYKAAEEYLTSLQGQVSRAEGRIEKLTSETNAKLVMEVRKAMDIIPFGFPKVKGIYVHVQTSPSILQFKTALGQPYIPKWYHLGYLSYNSSSDDVTSAQLTLYSVNFKDEEAAIASCDIDLRESIDTTLTRWHMLKWNWPFDAKNSLPQIEIRYWNLKNLEAFWTNMKVTVMDEMERVQNAIEYSKAFRVQE